MLAANGCKVRVVEAGEYVIMSDAMDVRCDGCGQIASAEHIARRLRRLEWATRYRPVHIHTLLLGGIAPGEDRDYLYSPAGEFHGEAADLLRSVGISSSGRLAEAVHAEFQSAGFFLAHLLECPLVNGRTESPFEDGGGSAANGAELLREHLPAVAARIRRSLKPKRVILVTEVTEQVVQDILSLDLGCPVVLDEGKPFGMSASAEGASSFRLRELLAKAVRN